jgi:hypothetical protein
MSFDLCTYITHGKIRGSTNTKHITIMTKEEGTIVMDHEGA